MWRRASFLGVRARGRAKRVRVGKEGGRKRWIRCTMRSVDGRRRIYNEGRGGVEVEWRRIDRNGVELRRVTNPSIYLSAPTNKGQVHCKAFCVPKNEPLQGKLGRTMTRDRSDQVT